MKKLWLIGAMIILTFALALGGIACGGGDKGNDGGSGLINNSGSNDSGSGSTKTGNADEYAGAFCTAVGKYAEDIDALGNTSEDMADPAAMSSAMGDMADLFKNMSKDLGKIDPPSEIADWHDSFVSALSDGADLMGKMQTALDKPLDEAMTEIEALTAEMDTIGEPLSSMTDLPAEYQTALETNSKCQALNDVNFFQ
jgi:hypothetical protein